MLGDEVFIFKLASINAHAATAISLQIGVDFSLRVDEIPTPRTLFRVIKNYII